MPDDFLDDDEDTIDLDDALDVINTLMSAFNIIMVQRNSHAYVQAVYDLPERLN